MSKIVTFARCLIPCFAQIINRSTTCTATTIHRNVSSFCFKRKFTTAQPMLKKETVTVHFTSIDGQSKMSAKAKVGDNLLDAVVDNDLDLDGYGACEGTLACSTCHLIFRQADYDKLPEEPSDEELDMLDLAYGVTDTSRLGCQITVTKDMDGLTVQVPSGLADAREPS